MNLFEPWTARGVTTRNRIVVSPMCQYSSEDGFANDWHFVHLGALSKGGAGIVFTEATAVSPEGRISPHDLGIYRDEHITELKRATSFIKRFGAVPGIQLAHAGRKASTPRPWDEGFQIPIDQGGWQVLGPTAIPFRDEYPHPRAMNQSDILRVVEAFGLATRRADQAGFEIVEVHAAHGYLIHQFLSPISNTRSDEYGGSLQKRFRLLEEVCLSVRAAWGEDRPIFVRVSATDWAEGGLTIEDSIQIAKWLRDLGIDLIDVSTGGNHSHAKIPVGPGYQVRFAEAIRKESEIAVGAVGMITDPIQGETILSTGQADLILMARELLRNPNWPIQAAKQLGVKLDYIPNQYIRAW